MDSAAAVGRAGEITPVPHRSGLLPAAVLLAGGVLAAVAPWVGVVRSFDGSAAGGVGVAALLVVLPGLFALVIALARPWLAAPVVAVAGVLALVRTCADVGVLVDPDGVVRPELFFETTLRAHPFRAGPGAFVLLAGDVVMVLAGLWAARSVVRDEDDVAPGRSAGVLGVGLTGVVLALVAALLQPYRGGFLDDWLLPPAAGGWSLGAAALGVALPAGAVLIAAGLPRASALAVAVAAGLTLVVAALIPMVAVAMGAGGLRLTAAPWCGLAGGLLVAGSGLAGARQPRRTDPFRWSELMGRLAGRLGWIASGSAVLAAGCAALAWTRPSLLVDGRPDAAGDWATAPGQVFSSGIGPPFAWAALLLALAGGVAMVGPAAAAGRLVLAVAWAVPGYALAEGLARYAEISVVVPNDLDATQVAAQAWTLGPGLWWGVAAFVLAVAAAVVSGAAVRRDADGAPVIDARLVDAAAAAARDDANAERRRRRFLLAALVGVAVLAAGFLPTFTAADRSGPTLNSLALGGVAMWVLTLATLLGLGLAAGGTSLAGVAGAVAGSVLTYQVRILLPTGLPDLHRGPGLLATVVVAVLLIAFGLVLRLVLAPIPEPVPVRKPDPRRSVGTRPTGKVPARRR